MSVLKKVDGNLKFAIHKTENGEIVYHKLPTEHGEKKQKVYTYSFESIREPDLKSDDFHQCLHYHIGRIIDEAAHWIGYYGDYQIEVIIKQWEN